jgi:signal peptidase II
MSLHDRTENVSRPAPANKHALRPAIFYMVALMVFAADQITKSVMQKRLALGESIQILGDGFRFTLAHNTGGAWGLLPAGNRFFVLFAVLAAICIALSYHRMRRMELTMAAAFALALGGATGNLLDRLRFGYVVDFFHAKIINWPIFNVADSSITIGICLLVLHFFRSAREEAAQERGKASGEQKAQG